MIELTKTVAQLLKQKASLIVKFDAENCAKQTILAQYQNEITDAHLYLLCSQGKLLRPLFVLLTAGCVGDESAVQLAYPAALAVECVHTYSLVHDDLPCMDNDRTRRGKPTTHVVYGDAKALLVGDGLLTMAFEILSQNTNDFFTPHLAIELIRSLSHACGSSGMIFGQWLDISEAQFPPVDTLSESDKIQIFQTIHKNKTGKLFAACFELGFLCGLQTLDRANTKEILFSFEEKQKIQKQFYTIGLDIGFSFQIIDDILDVTQNSETLGKTSGKDIEQNKWNAVTIFGLEKATQLADEAINRAKQNFAELYVTYFKQNQNAIYYQNFLELLNHLLKRHA